MTAKEVKILFEDHYGVTLTEDGLKKIYEHFSLFDENIIEESLECCFIQYEDANESFEKLGGICHSKSVQYIEN